MTVGTSVLYGKVLILDKPTILQTLTKCSEIGPHNRACESQRKQDPNDKGWLLPARHHRPRRGASYNTV